MQMLSNAGNAKERVVEARRLLLLARTADTLMSVRLTECAVKLMKPFFSKNNPQLGDAYVQLAQARYAVWQMCGGCLTFGAQRRLLSRGIAAMTDSVNVFERGMSTDKLARLQLELAYWLEQHGSHLQSARRYQSALITMAGIRGSRLSAAAATHAAHGFKRNMLLAAAVEHELPELKFNSWQRVFHP